MSEKFLRTKEQLVELRDQLKLDDIKVEGAKRDLQALESYDSSATVDNVIEAASILHRAKSDRDRTKARFDELEAYYQKQLDEIRRRAEEPS